MPTDQNVTTHAADLLFPALESANDDVLLSSPYLTREIAGRIASIAKGSKVGWKLLTKLDASAVAGGYLTVEGLRTLLDAGVEVADCKRLHAKAYLVGDNFGLIGSANLTGSGLGTTPVSNRELSVLLDSTSIPAVRKQLLDWWAESELTDLPRLKKLEDDAAALPKAIKTPPSPAAAIDPTAVDVEQLLADARGRNLWVKAQNSDPHLDGWRTNSWFSSSKKGKPSFVPGDLVLIYAKGAAGVYAVLEILDYPDDNPGLVAELTGSIEEGARWPWVNHTIPRLCPKELIIVTPEQFGITARGLENGHKKLTLNEFASAVRALADAM